MFFEIFDAYLFISHYNFTFSPHICIQCFSAISEHFKTLIAPYRAQIIVPASKSIVL